VGRSAIEVVQDFFDAPEVRRDVLAPDVEFLPLSKEPSMGPEKVVQALADIAELFREYEVHPAALVPLDDEQVLVQLERTGLTYRSEVRITDRFVQIFTVRSGRIVRIESFRTPEEARQSL
jgi:ketosteroid isomerase-like protein